MKKPYDIELIEQYLNNELEGDALNAFKQELAQDEKLVQAVAEHQDFISSIEVYGEQQLRQNMQEVAAELDTKGFFLIVADLDNYLDKKADVATTQKIETRLKEDSDFAKSLQTHEDARQSIELLGELELRNSISNAEAELAEEGFFDKKTKTENRPVRTLGRRIALRRVLAVAASIAVLVMAYFFIFQTDTTPKELYSAYYEPYTDNLSTEIELRLSETGFGTTDDMRVQLNLLLEGMQDYEVENFAAAAEKLESYRSTAGASSEFAQQAALYEAISRLELEQPQQAVTLLSPLAQDSSFAQQTDAQWYLALAYLQTEEPAAARSILQTLTGSEKYGKEAAEVLEKLQ